jgi:hypothetical protein
VGTTGVVETTPPYAIVDHEGDVGVIIIILDTKQEAEAIASELQRRGRRVHVEPAKEFTPS